MAVMALRQRISGEGGVRVRKRQVFPYKINITNTRLQTVADIRLGHMLPVFEAAQPPSIPIAYQV